MKTFRRGPHLRGRPIVLHQLRRQTRDHHHLKAPLRVLHGSLQEVLIPCLLSVGEPLIPSFMSLQQRRGKARDHHPPQSSPVYPAQHLLRAMVCLQRRF